jgi:hypothetical protein
MDLNLPEEAIISFKQLFHHIYKGDAHASQLSLAILHVLHTWDDIIDADVDLPDAMVNSAFLTVMTDISLSPLWDREMATLLRSVYFRWQAANNYEADLASSDNDLAKAWMLRAGCYDFFVLIANKLYGDAWAEHISPVVYRYYGETLITFIKEKRDA